MLFGDIVYYNQQHPVDPQASVLSFLYTNEQSANEIDNKGNQAKTTRESTHANNASTVATLPSSDPVLSVLVPIRMSVATRGYELNISISVAILRCRHNGVKDSRNP